MKILFYAILQVKNIGNLEKGKTSPAAIHPLSFFQESFLLAWLVWEKLVQKDLSLLAGSTVYLVKKEELH